MEFPTPWYKLVKQAGDIDPANIKKDITPPEKMEEGMPVAEPDLPTPARPPGTEPTQYLEQQKEEVEKAKTVVQDIWSLLTGEASEGGYKEVKSLLDAIKGIEAFISVEETGQLPKGTKASLNKEGDAEEAIFYTVKAILELSAPDHGLPPEERLPRIQMYAQEILQKLNEPTMISSEPPMSNEAMLKEVADMKEGIDKHYEALVTDKVAELKRPLNDDEDYVAHRQAEDKMISDMTKGIK